MNSSVRGTRFKLAVLWLAVLARAVGENSVRAYAVLKHSDGLYEYSFGFLFLWLGLSAAPAFALAPLIGALASSRWRWPAMIAATATGLAAIVWTTFHEHGRNDSYWFGCVAALAFESAFFSACRFAILPYASRQARVSLPQLNGLFAVAMGVGIFAGLWIGMVQQLVGLPGMPVLLQFGHIGYGLALVCIVFARFPAETFMRVNDGLILPFLRAIRAIFRDRNGRNSLIALWGLFAIGLAVSQWMLPRDARFFVALVVGVAAGGSHRNPFRTAGVVPYAATGLSIGAIWAVASGNWYNPAIGMAGFIGLMFVPLLTYYQIHQPDETRGHGAALLHGGWALITGCFLIFLLLFMADPSASKPIVGKGILALSLAVLLFTWLVFFRPLVEMTAEIFHSIFYRVRASGPGLHLMPWKGPILVIANHAAMFDPLWLAKVVPFPITPLLTSRIYDRPIISWLMRRVIGAIRVPDVIIRKDAPEIEDAISALKRGDCVVIFPEGWLRRKEAQELKRFGRGVWQILKAQPNTPVFPCWIEGGWGSMVSHKDGPPLKNKKIDFRRRIRIAVMEPIRVDPATLESHMATRTFLMKSVLQARPVLGLPPYDPFHVPDADGDDDKPAAPKPEAAP